MFAHFILFLCSILNKIQVYEICKSLSLMYISHGFRLLGNGNLLAGDLICGDLCKTTYFITKCVNFITLINRKGTREEEVEDILVVITAVK